MIGGKKGEVQVVCPKCNEKVVARAKDAEKGSVKCSRGHDIPVVKLMDMGDTGGDPKAPR